MLVDFCIVFAAGGEVVQSMKTNNTPSLLLDFHGLGVIFQLLWVRLARLEGSCGLLGVWWTIWLEFSAKLGSKTEQNELS